MVAEPVRGCRAMQSPSVTRSCWSRSDCITRYEAVFAGDKGLNRGPESKRVKWFHLMKYWVGRVLNIDCS